MISKYLKKIKINKEYYALFNSFMMDVIYCTKEEVENIYTENYDCFSKKEIQKLCDAGILIRDASLDKKAFDIVKNNVINNTRDFVSLMYLIPTSMCNLCCKYCFIGDICNDSGSVMSDEILYKALNEFSQHLKKKKINQGQIIFYGGEPLMNMNVIRKTVDFIKQNNLNILLSMVSNATLIDEEIAKYLVKNNIAIGISIDGPKDINDKNRIFKTNAELSVYDDIIDKIKILKDNNVNFGLSITLTNDILQNKMEFINWLKNLDVKNICFNLMHFTKRTEQWNDYYRKATEFLFLVKKKLPDVYEDRLNRKYVVFYNQNFKYSDCAAVGANQICVAPDGNVTICHGYWNNKRHGCGNIVDGLDNIISSEEYKSWNNNLTINKKTCKKCTAISICGGGCAMQAETLFDNTRSIDKAFCIHTKKVLKNLLINDFKNIYKL